MQVWMIEVGAGLAPIAQVGRVELLETRTSTRVLNEADDDDISSDGMLAARMLDTSTLTKVRQEGDDTDLSCDPSFASGRPGVLAELATKTDVQQESDDQMTASGMVELETRSANNQEGIDEDDWPDMLLELQAKTFVSVEEDDDCSIQH